MKHRLADLIDLETCQHLMDSFCEAIGIASAIIDLDGEVIIASHWQKVCCEFHRTNKQTAAKCHESDTALANALQEGKTYSIYQCHNGLTDAASPIIIEGQHVANIFVGQFLLKKPDMEAFRKQAQLYNFDEKEYLQAISEVPVHSEEKLPAILGFLSSLGNTIASMGLKCLRQIEMGNRIIRLNRILRALRNIDQLIIHQKDKTKLINAACSMLTETRGFNGAWIALTDETGAFTYFAQSNMEENFEKFIHSMKAGNISRCCRQAMLKNSVITVSDTQTYCQDCALKNTSMPKVMTTQLAFEGKIHGIISVHLPSDFNFDDSEKDLFSEIAGDIAYALSFIDSQDEKIKAVEALRHSEENMRITLQSIGDAVIATDTDSNIRQMNNVAEELTGWKLVEAKGLSLPIVFNIVNEHTRKPVKNPVELVLKSGQIEGLANHTVLIRRDGSEIPIADSGAPIRNTEGEIVGVVLVFRDVTEEYVLQEQLRQSQKMDSIGQLAGGIAHDFNNMLGGIIGGAELIEMQLPENSKLHEYIRMVLDGAERATDLTQKLLGFSRKTKMILTELDIHKSIDASIALVERCFDPRTTIEKSFNAPESTIKGDSTLLQNLFINLAVNARDAMPGGGALSFTTSEVTLKPDFCKKQAYTIEPGQYIKVQVRDTGIGMSDELKKRIFEPFFTTKSQDQGTGLGLSAVYSTVKEHMGIIQVESDEGRGSTFNVFLPLVKMSQKSFDTQSSPLVSGNGCVLVVEDESIMRTTVEAMLTSLGYDVIFAKDGQEAIEIFTRNKNHINMILLDIIIPKLSSREVFLKARSINPDIKILLSSGISQTENMLDLLETKGTEFLQKPYRLASLSKTISKLIAEKVPN